MNTGTERLDSEELLHLGLAASEKNQSEQAIEYMKRAIALSPDNANVHYLLGAEHASIGKYDEAISNMSRAIELNPALDTARFQLGLLYLTSKRADEAVATWQALDLLGTDHPLYLFKSGLISMAKDEFATCVQLLQQGIAANRTNDPLNADMQMVIGQVQALMASSASPALQGQAQMRGGEGSSSHLFISAYTERKE